MNQFDQQNLSSLHLLPILVSNVRIHRVSVVNVLLLVEYLIDKSLEFSKPSKNKKQLNKFNSFLFFFSFTFCLLSSSFCNFSATLA